MEIGKRIRNERKKKRISVKEFSSQLFEKLGIRKSVRTIERWELGQTAPSLAEIVELAAFFELKPSDLLDKNKVILKVETSELLKFGENISEYSQMNNINDLITVFYVTSKHDFRIMPRYDIELRAANDFLRDEFSFTTTMEFFKEILRCTYFGKRAMEESIFKHGEIIVHADYSGSRSHYDPRIITDYKEIVLAKESIVDNLYSLVSELNNLYDKSNLEDNYFVKKNTFI